MDALPVGNGMSGRSANCLPLDGRDVQRTAEMMARAFNEDPLLRYWIPDEEVRRRHAHLLFGVLIRYGIMYGMVHTTPGLEGVAVWLPPGRGKMSGLASLRSGAGILPALGKETARRMGVYGRAVSKVRGREGRRAWCLSPVAVEPEKQGQGICSSLLRPMFQFLDSKGSCCILETHSENGVSLYEHFGFRTYHILHMAEGDLTTYFMRRPPLERGGGP